VIWSSPSAQQPRQLLVFAIYELRFLCFASCMACFIRNHRECQRALTCAIVVLLVGTAALLLPRAARAEVVTSYKGWGWVQQPLGIAVPGWSWNSTGQAWSFRSLPSGTQVYLWPWSSDWEWVWTQDSGWLAVPMTYAMSPAAPTTAALLWSDEFGAAAGTGPSATDWNIQTGAFGYGGEACFTGANVKHNGVGQLASSQALRSTASASSAHLQQAKRSPTKPAPRARAEVAYGPRSGRSEPSGHGRLTARST